MVEFVSATSAGLAACNALIARSKAVWPWPAGYLEASLPLLAITPDYLARSMSFEVRDPGLVGFCALANAGGRHDRLLLDHLWINPDAIGRGLGRLACAHLCDVARAHDATELVVLPDPPSEGFYRRQGFEDTGERLASRVPGGPVFSRFRLTL